LNEVHAALLPHQKQETMLEMGKRFPDYFYVGDGMNDAPALAAGKVGIAIGSGASDAAIEHADVVILRDDLAEIGNLLSISRKTARIVRQNIALALGVKALAMIFAAFGYAPMWVAVIADTGVTALAVLNALRLLIFNPSR
jgi:Cd2+/Zn2+-exporting ATPase